MKQIVIQSEANDRSTDDVLDWLYYFGQDNEVRVDKYFGETNLESVKIELSTSGSSVYINENLLTGMAYWYRRGIFSYITKEQHVNGGDMEGLQKEYMEPVKQFIDRYPDAFGLNRPADNYITKLDMLKMATEFDINIPPTLITSKLDDVKDFYAKHGNLITKSTSNPFTSFLYGDFRIEASSPTVLLQKEDIDNFSSDVFMPSLFQKYICKKFEIRTFYLDGDCYSMCIFSQENPKTMIDFRNYDHQKPNRLSPFLLPIDLEHKIIGFMKGMKLKSGSIDLIYTPDKEYYFLEVNPIGQFQWLSRNCNYYLEKQIASYLLSKTH